ncbi:MAG: TolB family protein, partial [Candidatus Eiseniibacteriota bacterium]
ESGFGYGEFAISRDGTMVFVPGGNQLYVNIAFVTAAGTLDTLPFPRGAYSQPRVSPDGTRLAVQVRSPAGGWEVLLMNLTTGLKQQVQVEGNYRAFPASWLPSGRELMIGLWDPVQFLNYGARVQSLDTGAWRDLHLKGASYMTVSPDGKSFVYSDWRSGDLFLRALEGDTTRVRIPARGVAASFSPDGHWLAWGGVDGTVSASPVPPTGAIYPVAESGRMPLWSPKGDAIVYRDGARYYRVPITTAGGFHAGRSALLIEGTFLSSFAWNHAMSPDGRLLVLLSSAQRQSGSLGVVTGFPELVRRLAQARLK